MLKASAPWKVTTHITENITPGRNTHRRKVEDRHGKAIVSAQLVAGAPPPLDKHYIFHLSHDSERTTAAAMISAMKSKGVIAST